MIFNGTTGYLHISQNGTYYMYSTVLFQRSEALDHDVSLAVDIKIVTYCKPGLNKNGNIGFNPKHYVTIPKGTNRATYSVHTSGVARLCKNDIVYLHIHNMPPDDKVVILNKHGASTNFGTFMIAPSCQEVPDAPATKSTSSPTTSTDPHSQSSPTSQAPTRCGRRDC